jgi:predicted restriction endonuclease
LNFEFESFTDNIITFRWDLSYTVTVLYSSDNVEEILSKSIEKLHIPQDEINTIKEAIAKIRIGQSKFRTDLLKSNRNSCAFTEIFDDKLLIASHIKPWSVSNNDERLDENNGILLTPMFDKPFDKFLITFDEDGKLIWTQSRLDKLTKEKIIKGCIVDLNKFKMTINQSNNEYFNYHRLEFKKREKEN